MSEATNSGAGASDVLAGTEPTVHDGLFQVLVAGVNRSDCDDGLSVTVLAGGMMISGFLVSPQVYMRGLAEHWKSIGDCSEAGGRAVDDIAANFLKNMSDAAAAPDDGTRMMPKYFHLRDAAFWGGGARTGNASAKWWRGRMRDVAGFTIGRDLSAG